MDWISPLSGLAGALIGGGASLLASRQQLRAQAQFKELDLNVARLDQEDAARQRITEVLAPRLARLSDAYREGIAQGPDGQESVFWASAVLDAELAALEIPDQELRDLMSDSLHALRYWRSNFRNVQPHRQPVPAVLGHMVQCLFAWRRGEPLPEPSAAFEAAQEAWHLALDENESS
ncbi:hypothetical protein ACWGH2_42015 [Streptomyces sp. NPDC054871]